MPSHFSSAAPSTQGTLGIFEDGWADSATLLGGGVPSGLYDDARIKWFLEVSQGLTGKSVLELGPLEGAHTWMLEQAGARSITAVESNARAYLKCLVVKEVMGMHRAGFLFGDFMEFLRQNDEHFEAALACGVLYHLRDPHTLFPLLRSRCEGPVLLWTHYWNPTIQGRNPHLAKRLTSVREATLSTGKTVQFHRHDYERQVLSARFWGGNATYSEWMDRPGLEAAIEAGGWRIAETAFDEPDHVNGPSVAMLLQPVQ
jgi:hypothetical protein